MAAAETHAKLKESPRTWECLVYNYSLKIARFSGRWNQLDIVILTNCESRIRPVLCGYHTDLDWRWGGLYQSIIRYVFSGRDDAISAPCRRREYNLEVKNYESHLSKKMSAISPSPKNVTSTVAPVVETHPKEERSLVSILTSNPWTYRLTATGMAFGSVFLNHWFSGLCVQISRPDEYCEYFRIWKRTHSDYVIRAMPMSRECRQTWSCMAMS